MRGFCILYQTREMANLKVFCLDFVVKDSGQSRASFPQERATAKLHQKCHAISMVTSMHGFRREFHCSTSVGDRDRGGQNVRNARGGGFSKSSREHFPASL